MTKPTLIPDPNNANRGTVRGLGQVERSLQQYGAGRSILASSDGVILAGNKTYDRAVELGIPVQEIESDGKTLFVIKRTDLAYDDPRAKELAIADNRASEVGLEWDADVLTALADDGVDLEQFWFEDELDLLLNGEDDEPMGGNTDPDDVPDVPSDPVTKPGDLWLLGRHRLLCGDSTVVTDVDRLMDGVKAEMSVTSPPYNVGKTPNGDDQKYLNDSDRRSTDEYVQFLVDVTTNQVTNSEYVFVNLQSVAGNKIALIDYLSRMKDWFADYIIWDKLGAEPAMGNNVLNSRFEFVYVFSEKGTRAIGVKHFRGTLENMVFINSRQDKEFASVHSATYPVAFASHFVENFTNPNAAVFDPFLGSGTTLIACEQLNRVCYGMELDPAYCDVIVRRWEQFTGQTATLADETSRVKE